MTRPHRWIIPVSLVVLGTLACTNKDDDEETAVDTSDSDTTGELPPDPSPFTLTVSGGPDTTLTFDQPYCNNPTGSSNFTVIWRDSGDSHVFALLVQLLGDFDGAGTYDYSNANPRIKLQEEAGGQKQFYQVDPNQGHTLSVTIDHFDEEQAWGEFTFSGMDGSFGPLTVSPQPIPIWCPDVNG